MAAPDIQGALDHYLAVAVAALDPVPGKQFVLAGNEVPWDQCDCDGQVWSRVVSMVPIIANVKANGQPCTVLRWELTLAVGVIRCVAVPAEGSGKLPSGAKMTLDGHKAATDMANLVQAVLCDPNTLTMPGALPLGAQGGCAGSEVTFTTKLTPCNC